MVAGEEQLGGRFMRVQIDLLAGTVAVIKPKQASGMICFCSSLLQFFQTVILQTAEKAQQKIIVLKIEISGRKLSCCILRTTDLFTQTIA